MASDVPPQVERPDTTDRPVPLTTQSPDGVVGVALDFLHRASSATETPEQRERRVAVEKEKLVNKAAETVMTYIEKQELFVDIEPEQLLRTIRESELFTNELDPLLETACEGQLPYESIKTRVLPLVSVRSEKGEDIETIHGLEVQIAASLQSDPVTKKTWKHEYTYDFQERDCWQRLFPGTEPTLMRQQEADALLTEGHAAIKDLQAISDRVGSDPERIALAEKVLQGINVDADELATTINANLSALNLIPEGINYNGDFVRNTVIGTIGNRDMKPAEVAALLKDYERDTRGIGVMRDFIQNTPERNSLAFYKKLRTEFGEEKLKTYLRFKNSLLGSTPDISNQAVESDLAFIKGFDND